MKSSSCVVIDYGIGNVFSVMHALSSIGANPILTSDPSQIRNADRVILPGVGAFGQAAERLRELGLDDTIKTFIQSDRPFLGICVGMQLLMSKGFEFGTHEGLNVIPGTVEKIDINAENGKKIRVPLIGWYPLEPAHRELQAPSLTNLPLNGAYYFVHSFSVKAENPGSVLANVVHAGQTITAAVHMNNVIGLQFHPERSGEAGLNLLKNFLKL